jgi:hypothetical protein
MKETELTFIYYDLEIVMTLHTFSTRLAAWRGSFNTYTEDDIY